MENFDWKNDANVKKACNFFDMYVCAWNLRDGAHRSDIVFQALLNDPCLLNTIEIFTTVHVHDYQEIINHVQRHTKCKEGTCLQKKGKKLEC